MDKTGIEKEQGLDDRVKETEINKQKNAREGKKRGGEREVRVGGDKKMKERRRSLKFKFRKISV